MPERVLSVVAMFGVPLLLGLLLARYRRASGELQFRVVDLLVPVGLALQLVQVVPRSTSLAAGYALLLAWAGIRTATTRGPARLAFATLLLGGLLNAVPIMLNGAMPYSVSAGHVADGLKGVRIDDHTVLPLLADVIPLPGGRFMSVGDIVLALGTVLTVSLVLPSAPRRRHAATDPTPMET